MKVVSFDVTGTLMRVRESPGFQYFKLSKEYGWKGFGDLSVGEHEEIAALSKGFFMAWKTLNHTHPNFGYGTILSEEWWNRIFYSSFEYTTKYLLEKNGINNSSVNPYSFFPSNQIFSKIYQIFATPNCWEIYPDVIPSLEDLKSRNIKLCITSNNDERLPKLLSNMQIAHYFDLVTTSYSCGVQKPDPYIFQLAFSLLEHIPHDHKEHRSLVLHVGDNKHNDYDGAINAGISSLLLTRENHNSDSHTISSLLQLTEKLNIR